MAWNGSGGSGVNKQPDKGKARRQVIGTKWIALGLTVLVVGGCLWYFATREVKDERTEESAKRRSKKIADVQPAAAAPAQQQADKKDENDPNAERRAKLAKMTKSERLEYFLEEAKKKPLDLSPSTNRAFRTGTEQVLAWIFTLKVGSVPPPLPPIPIRDEAHMAEILTANNPALEGDSEKVREAKQMVELAKEELRKFVKQGGEVSEFMQYYHGQLVQAHQEWQDSQRSVMQIIRDDPDLAPDYIREVNKRLAEKGIKPVNIPKKLKERLGLDLEPEPGSEPDQQVQESEQ